jgi:hypothetical protein
MATNKDFIVKNGLQVGGDIVVTGSLQTSGLTLPASDGTSGQVIVTDGSGNLSFQSVTTNAFSRIEVNGQTAITTDQVGDTLSFVAGDNITITTDEPNDAITISASQYTDAEAVDAVEAAEHLTIDGGTLYVDTANNYVGIGDTSPQHKLDVAGGIGIGGTEVITSAGQIVGPVADSALTIGGSLTGNLSKVAVVYSPTEPSSPIQGQFYFDSLNQKMKVYTGSAWIDAVPPGTGTGGGDTTDAVATFEKFQYTITSTTNAVSGSDDNSNTLSYIVDGSQNVEVFVNGIKQYEGATADYVATTGSSVTFTYNLEQDDVVDVQVYELLTQDAFYLKSETFTKTETNTQIASAVNSYLPLTGGTLTGDLVTTGLTVDGTTLVVDKLNNRVGIGTDSPSQALEVVGNIKNTNSITIGSNGLYEAGSIFSDANWGMIFRAKQANPVQANFMWADSSNTELMRIDSSGTLIHRGAAVFNENGGNSDFRVESDTNTHALFVAASGNHIIFGSDNGANMYNGAGTNPGIQFELGYGTIVHQANGNANYYMSKASGYTNTNFIVFSVAGATVGSINTNGAGTTYNTTSDRRLKDNITTITNGKEKLLAMNPVTHTWKADPNTGETVHGFIAQEMQQIVPEAVSGDPDSDQMMSMDYGRITPVIVAALQDALKEIEELKERIKTLEAK